MKEADVLLVLTRSTIKLYSLYREYRFANKIYYFLFSTCFFGLIFFSKVASKIEWDRLSFIF